MSRIKYERNISYDTIRQVYYLYMDSGKDDEGKRKRKYQTYSSLLAARQARDAFLSEKNKAKAVRPSDMTLGDWLQVWMREVILPNRAETTIYSYRSIINNHLIPALGTIPIQRLSPKDLQHYYAYLMEEKGLCANTVRRHHDLLSSALHRAVHQELIARCPTERVEPPHVIPKETHFYTSENLKQLYALMEGHWLETAVHLAGSMGLRREEICGLRWESVDFQLRKLHIRAARTTAGNRIIDKETKNRSSTRVLHMEDDIYRLLRREQREQERRKRLLGEAWPDSGMVAIDPKGRPLPPNRLSRSFSYFIHRHPELPPLTFHGLRHTFATVASAQGVPLFDIGKALGHSTPATTGRIYTHLVDQLHTETMSKVSKALK